MLSPLAISTSEERRGCHGDRSEVISETYLETLHIRYKAGNTLTWSWYCTILYSTVHYCTVL